MDTNTNSQTPLKKATQEIPEYIPRNNTNPSWIDSQKNSLQIKILIFVVLALMSIASTMIAISYFRAGFKMGGWNESNKRLLHVLHGVVAKTGLVLVTPHPAI